MNIPSSPYLSFYNGVKHTLLSKRVSQDFELARASHKDIDPTLVQMVLHRLNKNVAKKAKEILLREIPELSKTEDLCVYTTGSDGRKEKMLPLSPVEIVLVTTENNDETQKVKEKITLITQKYPGIFHTIVEFKILGLDKMIEFKSTHAIIPTRPFDAKFLIGSKDVFKKVKAQSFKEIIEIPSKKFFKFKMFFVQPSVKTLEHGREGKCESFDILTGELKFDGDRTKSTKFSHLRPVQYTLAFQIFKALRQGTLTPERLKDLPKSTIERLAWFSDQGLTKYSEKEVFSLIKAYTLAAVWFANSESKFLRDHEEIIRVNPHELRWVSETIFKFAKSDFLKLPKNKNKDKLQLN